MLDFEIQMNFPNEFPNLQWFGNSINSFTKICNSSQNYFFTVDYSLLFNDLISGVKAWVRIRLLEVIMKEQNILKNLICKRSRRFEDEVALFAKNQDRFTISSHNKSPKASMRFPQNRKSLLTCPATIRLNWDLRYTNIRWDNSHKNKHILCEWC